MRISHPVCLIISCVTAALLYYSSPPKSMSLRSSSESSSTTTSSKILKDADHGSSCACSLRHKNKSKPKLLQPVKSDIDTLVTKLLKPIPVDNALNISVNDRATRLDVVRSTENEICGLTDEGRPWLFRTGDLRRIRNGEDLQLSSTKHFGYIQTSANSALALKLSDFESARAANPALRSSSLAFSRSPVTLAETSLDQVFCASLYPAEESKTIAEIQVSNHEISTAVTSSEPELEAAEEEIAIPILNTNPDSSRVIFVDFDGHLLPPTGVTGGQERQLDPWIASESSYTTYFNRVAAYFSSLDVNITTDVAVFDAVPSTQRTRLIPTVSSGWYSNSSALGIAIVGSFSSSSEFPAIIFADRIISDFGPMTSSGIQASVHELGHSLGLNHDGRGRSSYHTGSYASGYTWLPIMGSGSNYNLMQWTQGDYDQSNRFQDDLDILTKDNGINFITDEHGDSPHSATTVNTDAVFASAIEREGDIDTFAIYLANDATLSAEATTPTRGMLDIKLRLLDGGLNEVLLKATERQRNETLSFTHSGSPGAWYYLQLEPSENAAPYYSAYGSIGTYSLTISGVSTPSGEAPTPLDSEILASFNFDGTVTDLSPFSRVATLNGGLDASAFSQGYADFSQSSGHISIPAIAGDFRTIAFRYRAARALTGEDASEQVIGFGDSHLGEIRIGSTTDEIDDETLTIENFGASALTDPIDTTWHHYTFVWNGRQYDIYLDGTRQTTTKAYHNPSSAVQGNTNNSDSNNPANLLSHRALAIGSGSTGSIDDLIIFNRSLSQTEIDALQSEAEPDTTAPAVALDIAEGTEFSQGNLISLSSTASDDIGVTRVDFFSGGELIGSDSDASGGWTFSWSGAALGPHAITSTAFDAAANSATSAAINITIVPFVDTDLDGVGDVSDAFPHDALRWETGATHSDSDLLVHYSFDAISTGSVADHSANSNTGTIVNLVPSALGGGIDFSPANGYVSVPALNADYRTIAFRYKSTTGIVGDDSNSQPILNIGHNNRYGFIWAGASTSGASGETITIGYNGTTSLTTPIDTAWHHYAFVWNNSDYDIYLDGIKQNTLHNGGANSADLLTAQGFELGARSNTAHFSTAAIDDFVVFSRSLNTAEVNNLITGQAITDGVDADADGIPDFWEKAYFGDITHSPENDDDGDGMSNEEEYSANTDPTSASSHLTATSTTTLNNGKLDLVITIENSAIDRRYTLLNSDDLGIASPWVAVPGESNKAGNGGPMAFSVNGASPGFYRIKVALP